ncbi:endonuclease/exonuclease/phosphatase family protein [candidate division KSB1 bacterium]|nr:endonuclease/exonuclease/phosphatase family protein [candidate division KSB1 bacterium]
MAKKFLLFLVSLFWLTMILIQLFVYNPVIRFSLVGEYPTLEILSGMFCDVIWLPVALVFPVYFAYLLAKATKIKGLKWLSVFLCCFIFFVCVFFPLLFFQYFIYVIILFFVLVFFYLFQIRSLQKNIIIYSFALVGLLLFYNKQMFPPLYFHVHHSSPKLRLMTYNILIDLPARQKNRAIEFIKREKPDVVFIQEMNAATKKYVQDRLDKLYPYQVWSDNRTTYMGGVILSRLPFLHSGNIKINTEFMQGHTNLNHAVIHFNGSDIHIFNCHLFHGAHAFINLLLGNIDRRTYLQQLGAAYARHRAEAIQISQIVTNVDAPVILVGDFNNTPNSQIFRFFSDRFINAFNKAGWGLGTTFGEFILRGSVPVRLRFLLFDFLRIDHIFSSSHFKILSAQVYKISASDHKPMIVELTLKK